MKPHSNRISVKVVNIVKLLVIDHKSGVESTYNAITYATLTIV